MRGVISPTSPLDWERRQRDPLSYLALVHFGPLLSLLTLLTLLTLLDSQRLTVARLTSGKPHLHVPPVLPVRLCCVQLLLPVIILGPIPLPRTNVPRSVGCSCSRTRAS
jgi:hypothetical protein